MGEVSRGVDLPDGRHGHCMVNLPDGRIMILGGSWTHEKEVLIFDPNTNTFSNGTSMLFERVGAGCVVFKSSIHDNRDVVLIVGGGGENTAEVYDYTTAGSVWEESKNF